MPYSEWDDNSTPIPPSLDLMQYELAQKKPSPVDIVKAGIENMPGASFAQGVAPLVNFPFQVAGSALYGLGKQLFSPEADFNKDTTEAMRALQYEPPTQAGKEFQESIGTALEASKLPPYVGHMPPMRFNANDVRVLAKQNIERAREVASIPEDFRNAQSGIRRESNLGGETYGTNLQAVAEDIGDTLERNKARRNRYETSPKSSVEVFGDLVPETRQYAVRNTGEGQMIRPTATANGMEPNGVDFGETEALLKEVAPPLASSRPQDIIDAYEQHYMSANTPEIRALNFDWEKFQTEQIKKLYPDFSQADAFKALRAGYSPNLIQDMKLKWFHDFVSQEKAKGAPIPTMEEFFGRAQSANTLTKKIIPNIIQKYIGTPNDPFLEMAKKGITMNPSDELVEKYGKNSDTLRSMRGQAGFAQEGEIADKFMPVAESKLATQTSELDQLIAEQNQIGQTEGMMVPYPDGRIDPETGQVAMATNPNYAKFTNKIGALRKMIGDTEEEIRNLKIAQAYENVSDASIRMAPAYEWRNRIPPAEQQFHPAIFGEKERATPESEREFKTPAEAPFFEANTQGLTKAGIVPLTKDLISKIMSGEIPPEQVPSLSQPHTITKFMADIVAPRLEKEKAARLAQVNYKENVGKHFIEVLNNPAVMPLTDNAKLLWLDDGYDADFINQALSDETFVLDHCIGQSGNGRGLKNLFTGDDRQYIPMIDPVTGQKFKGAGNTSSYMDSVESGEKDIMMLRDSTTGMPVGTIELSKVQDVDTGEDRYDIGYVSGYKNHSNKFGGIDPKYREALRDALNKVGDEVVSSAGNEARSGVYDMRDRDQLNELRKKLDLPNRTTEDKQKAWAGVQKSIMDTLDGDRYITIEQAEEALKQYKADNPPVPAVRSGFPPAGKDVIERNIVMQGLSRDNLDTARQFNAARIVADGTRFDALPLAPSQMEPRPLAAYRGILNSLSNRAGNTGMSDYQVFRHLQDYVDQIDNGDLRFADFNLGGHSELLDLREGLQKHADAMGQLAHYADVLQRNGYRSPLPSEQTGTPEWQAYQRFIGELDLNDPQDISTRLRDMINHGDPREIDPNLDELQRENFRHLLEIHDRSLKQAVNFPAPTAPASQAGIPLSQWDDVTRQAMESIQAHHGNQTRETIGNIMVDAIRQDMNVAVNERPTQVSNFLLSQARDTTWPVAVRNGLRELAGAIDSAYADIQNANNAPTTPALPTLTEYREAVTRGVRDLDNATSLDVLAVYDDIVTRMNRDGDLVHQHPQEVVRRLTDNANYQEAEGEPATANGLRSLARSISELIPANPPASMALAMENRPQMIAGGMDNLTPMQRIGARVAQMREVDEGLANSVMRMLDTYDYGRLITENPAELTRGLRNEANEAMEGGEAEFGHALINVTNDIAEATGGTTFTPAPARAEPRRSPRDIALSVNGLVGENIDEMANLIQIELRDLPTDRVALRQADLFYQDANNLPDEITNLTHDYQDAERIANYIRQHIESRLGNLPQAQNQLTTAGMPTPRDVAELVPPDSTHQSLEQRQRQVETLANGINNEIRSLATDQAGLERALEFYQDYDNLPTEIMARIPSEEDANRVLAYIRQHIQNRIANLPENRGQDLQASYERVSDEIRNTYTGNYLQQFQDGDVDIRNNVLQDVADRPAVYGMARLSAQQQRDMVERLRTEGLAPQDMEQQARAQLPAPAQTANFPDAEQLRTIARSHTNEFTGSSDSFRRIARDIRDMAPEDRLNALDRMVRDTSRNAGLDEGMRNTYGVDSPAGMSQLNNALIRLREDLRDRNLLNELQAPAENNNASRIMNAISDRSQRVNREHLGISQRFDTVVQAAQAEYNPVTDPINFINSLHHRANSINGVQGIDNESRMLANMLSHLADDVNDVLHVQAPALPAPEPVAQHYDRVENGVNQPAGLGALDRNDSDLLRMQTTNFLNGDRNALTNLSPTQRHMAQQLTRYNEPDPTIINELDHRRLINTLVSQTYNPATDGEALIRLAETRAGMFAGLDDAQREQVIDIVNKWNFLRFPNYAPPEEGMGEDPRGHKRGGAIRKMNEGGEPPKLTPYEQFKIDNAERIRQGQEDIENRNKYDPYKGSDKPIPTQRSAPRGGGSAGTIPSGSGTTLLDRPHLYSIGGKVYMDIGGQVKPVPNVPYTPEKTNPNTTDHVIRKPADEGFKEVLERVRNTPKPTGSAGTMPSGNGASYLDRPHLYAGGGRIHMNEGGLPEDIQRALTEGKITQNQADYIHNSRLNPVPEHWGDHMSYQDRYNESLEPRPKYVPPTEEEIRIREFLEKQDPMRQPNVDMNREQLREHAFQTQNPATFRANPSRVGGGGGGSGGAGADLEFQGLIAKHPKAIYAKGGDVNIDAMRLALMKG